MNACLNLSTSTKTSSQPAGASRRDDPMVLVVDDDPMIASLIEAVLEGAGYRVCTATGGTEAVALATISPPDILLVDLTMPEISGPETMARMRKLQPALPTLVVSGVSAEEARAAAPEANAFLEKPFKFDALLRAVAGLRFSPMAV